MSNEFDLTLYRRRGQVVVWGTNYYNCLKISSCIVVDVVQSLSLSSSLQPHGLQLGRLLSQCLLKLKSTESVMLSNHLILCCLFLLLSSIFPNNRVFFKESALCIGWSKYWSFSFSISPSNEYSEPISFPERTQTHVHWLGDAIQSSNPLSSPSPSFNLSQHHFFFFPMSHFFISGGQSIGVSASASVLPMSIEDWFPPGWTSWISLLAKGLSRVFSKTTVQKYQFFGAQLSL